MIPFKRTNELMDYDVADDELGTDTVNSITSYNLDLFFMGIIKVLLDLDLIPIMNVIKEGSEITILPIHDGENIKRVNVNIHGHFDFSYYRFFTNFNILRNRKYLSYISKHEDDGSIYKICHRCYEVYDTDMFLIRFWYASEKTIGTDLLRCGAVISIANVSSH